MTPYSTWKSIRFAFLQYIICIIFARHVRVLVWISIAMFRFVMFAECGVVRSYCKSSMNIPLSVLLKIRARGAHVRSWRGNEKRGQ